MKPITFVIVMLTAGWLNGISAQNLDPSDSNIPTIDIAMDLYNAHKYKESIPEFSKVIKEDEKNGKAFYYRGMAKMHEKQNGFCKDLEESLKLGYATSADIYYYGCETHTK